MIPPIRWPLASAIAWSRRRVTAALVTIRGKILLALLVMSTITASLGIYATMSIRQAAGLVVETFDRSLMSISFARAAEADFAAMRAAFERGRADAAPQPAAQQRKLALLMAEDLGIAATRARSAPAAAAARAAQAAVDRWEQDAALLAATPGSAERRGALDRDAAAVDRQIELLINLTAGDGFLYRQRALGSIGEQASLAGIGTLLALLLSGGVAWMLARRIIGPVAAASAVAERIARGELDTVVPPGGGDELGRLLASMDKMRGSISSAMAWEVAQRQSAQTRLVDAIEGSREGVVLLDAERRVVAANTQAMSFFGGYAALETVAAESHAAGGEEEERLTNGRWLRISRSTTHEDGVVAICSDITAIKQREAELEQINLCLDAALSNMSQGLCLYDTDDHLRMANRRFCEIYRLPPAFIRPGLSLRAVLEHSLATGYGFATTLDDLHVQYLTAVARDDGEPRIEQLRDGRMIAVVHRRLGDGGSIVTYEDVTERRRTEAQILFMARHDALTGLPNRVLLRERLDQALGQFGRGSGFAVLYLDLDRFKNVNDTLGHALGDELLRAVGDRLRACAREVDTVARLGGDEFAIVQLGVGGPADAAVLAERVIAVVSEPYDLKGHRVVIGTSCGIAIPPEAGTSCETLLKNADLALYRAKTDGRGIFRIYEREMEARLQGRLTIEADLRRAIERGELELFYQPEVELASGEISACEALLRWPHPTRGMIPPAEFIPVAEETGLIVALGEWAVRRACRDARRWPTPARVAVNVSALQFRHPGLVPAILDALADSGLPPERLEVEVTESVLLEANEAILAALRELHEHGVQIALDDFGTGFSSLSYLGSFPLDRIKIDRSFVRDMTRKAEAASIVRAIVGLARSLGMRTTAEGVETPEQLARVRADGCTEVQGHYFSAACPAGELLELMRRWRSRALAVA